MNRLFKISSIFLCLFASSMIFVKSETGDNLVMYSSDCISKEQLAVYQDIKYTTAGSTLTIINVPDAYATINGNKQSDSDVTDDKIVIEEYDGSTVEIIPNIDITDINIREEVINGKLGDIPEKDKDAAKARLEDACKTTIANPSPIYTIDSGVDVTEDLVYNPLYYSQQCNDFRSKYSDDEDAKDYVPHCYNLSIEASEASTTEEALEKLIAGYEPDDDSTDSSTNITADGNNVSSVDMSGNNFVCDSSLDSNAKTVSAIQTKSTSESCETTCKETVELSYGPPVITQAGMGISYEVTTTTTLTCSNNYTGNKPDKNNYTVCVPRPDCNGGKWNDKHNEYAGPNDEFDSCVQSCDGGKYTQDCINQCYDSVYGKSSNKLPLNYSNKSITLIPVYATCTNLSSNVGNPQGEYKKDENEKLFWDPSNNNICSSMGYYYYANSTIATNTDKRLKGEITGRTYDHYKVVNGFLYGAMKDDKTCNAKCSWKGCSVKLDWYLTKKQANEQYRKDLKAYKEAKATCKAQNITSTNEEKYTVTVYNDTIKTEDKDGKTFDSTETNMEGMISVESSSEAGQEKKYNFPKSYISLIDGNVKYDESFKNNKNYISGGNKFYTSLTSESVNTDWYDWKIEDGTGDYTGTVDNYNIKAELTGVGAFDWKFNISCFYALRNGDIPDDGDDDHDDDHEEPKYKQYIFRPIDLNNMFPEREPRWNWTNEAYNTTYKDKNEQDYMQQKPSQIIDSVESRGNTIYNENYLEYEITLDRGKITSVRDYNKNHTYLTYEMADSTAKPFFYSNFIESNSFITRKSDVGVNRTYK